VGGRTRRDHVRSRFASGVCAGVFLLSVGAACSSGEGGSGGKAKREYIQQVDVLCRNTINQVNSIGKGTDTATLEKVSQAWTQLADRLRLPGGAKRAGIPLPSEDFDLGAKFVTGVNNVSLGAEGAWQASIVKNQSLVTRTLNEEAQSKKTTSQAAKEYGFKECDKLDTT
jgi:hypothetical protein